MMMTTRDYALRQRIKQNKRNNCQQQQYNSKNDEAAKFLAVVERRSKTKNPKHLESTSSANL